MKTYLVEEPEVVAVKRDRLVKLEYYSELLDILFDKGLGKTTMYDEAIRELNRDTIDD